jgi:hypothetical protein
MLAWGLAFFLGRGFGNLLYNRIGVFWTQDKLGRAVNINIFSWWQVHSCVLSSKIIFHNI